MTVHWGSPAHLADDAADGGTLVGVELGHQVVCRVGHHCAEHPCDVPGRERHAQLLVLGALRLGLGDHILVQRLNGVLKARCMRSSNPSDVRLAASANSR